MSDHIAPNTPKVDKTTPLREKIKVLIERTARGVPKSRRVLDFGCGYGFYFQINPLAQGVDGDPDCVNFINARFNDDKVKLANFLEKLPSIKNINSGSLWASDNFAVDAILTANGKSQLSGQQLTGPKKEMWEIIDPISQYNNFWNSGASYVGIQFVDSENIPEITKPAQDTIQIKLNPCSTVSKNLNLRYLISSNDLKMPCLAKLNTIPVNHLGIPFWLYEIVN